jgi:hypothetical protein
LILIGFLDDLDGRWSPRRVKGDGSLQVDGTSSSIRQTLAAHRILLRLNATTRCLDVFEGEAFLKSVPIKGLRGEQMALEASIDLMRERARSQERQRLLLQRRARLQGEQSA